VTSGGGGGGGGGAGSKLRLLFTKEINRGSTVGEAACRTSRKVHTVMREVCFGKTGNVVVVAGIC